MAGLRVVNKRSLRGARSQLPGKDETYAPLYDSATYTSASTTLMSFFVTPKGQGTTTAPGAAGPKSLADTNLQVAGQLPRGNLLLCTGIEFHIFPGVNPGRGGVADATAGHFVNDMYLLLKAGVVQFTVSNRNYIEDGPLINFPPLNRLVGFSGSATNTTAAASLYSEIGYAAAGGQSYALVPILLSPNQAFSVSVTFPAAVTTASGTNARVFCRLRGRFVRDVQ